MVIELNGSKRTVTVSVFKGKVLINIREYYEVRYLVRLRSPCKPLCTDGPDAMSDFKTINLLTRLPAASIESQPPNTFDEPARRKTERCFPARRRDVKYAALLVVSERPGDIAVKFLVLKRPWRPGHILDDGAVRGAGDSSCRHQRCSRCKGLQLLRAAWQQVRRLHNEPSVCTHALPQVPALTHPRQSTGWTCLARPRACPPDSQCLLVGSMLGHIRKHTCVLLLLQVRTRRAQANAVVAYFCVAST